MYIRTIGRTRERATHPRLMRFARGVGARVPCDRATVQPTVQSATTAGCSHSRWVDPHVSYVQAHHRSDPRAGCTHTARAVCARGWGLGAMRASHGATHRPIRNDGRRSHSRWVDPHVGYVHPHHRSDPTHTAHAACAWGWGPGPMRSSHGATHRPIRNDGRLQSLQVGRPPRELCTSAP